MAKSDLDQIIAMAGHDDKKQDMINKRVSDNIVLDIGEDNKIYVIINEKQFLEKGMYCVIETICVQNYLLTDAKDKFKKLWFPQSAQKRYDNLIKLISK